MFDEAPPKPVFFDASGRRKRRLTRVTMIAGSVVSLLFAVLVVSVLVRPLLPPLDLPTKHFFAEPDLAFAAPVRPKFKRATRAFAGFRQRSSKVARAAAASVIPAKGPPAPAVSAAFYVNWDDTSYQSLKLHVRQLDWVIPEWVRLDEGSRPVVYEPDKRVLALLAGTNRPLVLPLVHNSQNGQWNSTAVTKAVDTQSSRSALVASLRDLARQNAFSGLIIDFETVPPASQAGLLLFVQQLHDGLHADGRLLGIAVPFADEAWDYGAYGEATDYVFLMAYDEHWAASEPGPIASQEWFENTLEQRLQILAEEKTLVCLGAYGYNWTQGSQATAVSYQEAVLSAHDSDARIRLDPTSLNPHFGYQEEDGSKHTVWFLDGVTAFNQLQVVRTQGIAGAALWRLGSEDPSTWSVFGREASTTDPGGLRKIRFGYDVDFEGRGELLEVVASPQDGGRTLQVDPGSGLITTTELTSYPSSFVIRRAGYRPGLVALTFDDGPDPTWTPKVLDVLAREHVPGTFFIIGESGQEHPELLRRLVAEGHELGNHTYTHPNLGETTGPITTLELNATQSLIEAITGRSTLLFRAPFFGDAEPTTPDEVGPAEHAQKLGYLTVGLHVDPGDWSRPGVDEIVSRIIAGVTNKDPDRGGQVVLLHDGGGNRQETVDALPRVISELRARSYRFVLVSELANMTRDQVMPMVVGPRKLMNNANSMTFYGLFAATSALHWLFVLGIALGVARIAILLPLAWLQRRRASARKAPHEDRRADPRDDGDLALVTVLVPAYNEERVIAQTVESLLTSTYPSIEVVVIDDGSKDETAAVVRRRFGSDARVRLVQQANAGKPAALNRGLLEARGEFVVALDGDTLFEKDTVRRLVDEFTDARVGAVAGNAKVGNRVNLVTRWQALEYVTSQNLDRRAFALLNAITVVPGAVGAWRREAIQKAGGFSDDTLAEDQDLTLLLLRNGWRVAYAEDARAWTEAPETLRGLAKQRFRWSFGTLQCMWKHRRALGRPRYGALGLVAMPNVWLFQVLFSLVSPVMDFALGWIVLMTALEAIEHPAERAGTYLMSVLFYYAFFLAVDWLGAATAFALEKTEQWSLLIWLLLQRFAYRQVMYYVMLRSVAAALRGSIVGWNKLERRGSVAVR